MNNLVSITDKKAITTSLIVAEYFNKRHSDMLTRFKAVECSDEFAERNFSLGYYIDGNKQSRPMYEMTRDGFTFFVMGMTGKKAAIFKEKFIEAFNSMEQALLEGRGEHKQIDIEYNRTRRLENPHGIDIKYSLDLTKIVMSPTRAGLDLLEKLTGVDMSEINLPTTSNADTFINLSRFIAEACQQDPTNQTILGQLHAAYADWCRNQDETVVSKIIFGRRLNEMGYQKISHGGQTWITGLALQGLSA